MNTNPLNLLSNVSVLDEVDIETAEFPFTLIYSNDTGMHVNAMTASIPVRVERLVSFSIESLHPSITLPLPTLNSLKSSAVLVRNISFNMFNRFAKILEYDDLVYDFRGVPPNNIAHLMNHIIPLVLHVQKHTSQPIHFVFDKLSPPFKKLLEIFGVNPIVTLRGISGSFVKVFVTRGLAAHNALDIFDTAPYSFLPNSYDSYDFKSGLENIKKIFIARRGERGLVNLDEVEALLTSRGYKTIYMEDYPLEVQLGIASEAKDIVAVHGASMGMLSMNRDINTLIEILPRNIYHDYFTVALGHNVKKHVQIIEYFDRRTTFNPWETIAQLKSQVFSVDIPQLEKALELINTK